MADEQQELSEQIDELLAPIEKLCAQSEITWRKGSPQAREMCAQNQATQVLLERCARLGLTTR